MRPPRQWLLLIFLAALAIRLACVIVWQGEIESEGAEYISLAQNLLAGAGYIGLGREGPNLFHPPLFPGLIAGLTLLSGDAEFAGRAISSLMGALLVWPIYLLARRLYGPRLALASAALAGFHPFLVQFSTTVYCESTFLTLLCGGVAAAMYAADRPRSGSFALAGLLYGLAYLVRPEGMIYLLVGMLGIVAGAAVQGPTMLRAAARRLPLLPLAFIIVAGPYIGWLSVQTGQFRIEAKSALNGETILRMQQGQSMEEARTRVDPDLTPRGVAIQPNIRILTSYQTSAAQLAALVAKQLKPVVRAATAAIAGNVQFGSPALFALAVLGVFSRPWRGRQAVDQLHLLVLLSLSIGANCFIFYSAPRFYLLYLALACIWVPVGIAHLVGWARASANGPGAARRQRWIGAAMAGAALAAVFALAGPPALSGLAYARSTRSIEQAAASLVAPGRALRIADTSVTFAYHAHANFVLLPYCDEVTALRYLERVKATHVVLRETDLASLPYVAHWMQAGVPQARRLLQLVDGNGERLDVYELHRSSDG